MHLQMTIALVIFLYYLIVFYFRFPFLDSLHFLNSVPF